MSASFSMFSGENDIFMLCISFCSFTQARTTKASSWSILLLVRYLCGFLITKNPIGRGFTGTAKTDFAINLWYTAYSPGNCSRTSSISGTTIAVLSCIAVTHLWRNSADSNSCKRSSVLSFGLGLYQWVGVHNPNSRSTSRKPIQSPL